MAGRGAGAHPTAAVLAGNYGAPDVTGVTVDLQGRIYLTVGEMHVLQRLSPLGKTHITRGNRVSDPFSRPAGIAVDRSSVLYLADTNDAVIKKLAPSGLTLATWVTAGYPQAVALDSLGNVYVTSVKGDTSTLQVFSPEGNVLRQWLIPGREGDTRGANAVSIAVDDAGEVYVAELSALQVQKFSPSG